MLTQGDELLATMTNMGGFMQPQGHLNLLCNMVDFGLDPQVSSAFALTVSQHCIPIDLPMPSVSAAAAATFARLRIRHCVSVS